MMGLDGQCQETVCTLSVCPRYSSSLVLEMESTWPLEGGLGEQKGCVMVGMEVLEVTG